jgi:leucyl aminopeptidase
MKIQFSDGKLPKDGTLILALNEGPEWGKTGKALNKKMDGALESAAAKQRFKGKKGEVLTLLAPSGLGYDRLVVIGLGEARELTEQKLVDTGGMAIAAIPQNLVDHASVAIELARAAPVEEGEAAALFAQGLFLRSYRFDKYFTKKPQDKKPVLRSITVLTSEATKAKRAYGNYEGVAEGVCVARDLVSEPANVLYPETLAKEAQKLKSLGVLVTVLEPAALKKLGMGALLGVAQGSVRPARVVIMSYKGNPKAKTKRPIAFVGKGVTFDTGGISIKPAGGMEDMKYDMGGSAAVIGTMYALASRKAKVNAIGAVGLVENMPDGNAQRPGDVVTSMSGQTIEVINTDAEGRLVLCDVMSYVQEKFKPHTMIDLATLTGAIVVSLGTNEYCGLFANNDELSERLGKAGQMVDERVWRFPMNDAYDKMINSDIADMKNVSDGRGAGSITAAQFLGRFVDRNVAWAHLDIAGMAWARKDFATTPKGATGYGVRLLDRLVAEFYEGK